MSSNKETFGKTIGFVFIVCLVCAALVSISAVGLKPLQTANKLLDKQTKILETAGLLELAGTDIVGTYNKFVDAKMIDLATGKVVEGDVNSFEERADARDASKSSKPENDIAGLSRRANNAVVYFVNDEQGKISTIVLPIVGSGLWDLMYGFVGLEADMNTVKSVVYSDLKETPGLGAEVLNPKWKALWPGKKMFDEQNNIEWAKVLSAAGIKVIFGIPALKVHSKLCIIHRREKGQIAKYVHVGTGNFHEKTARIYTDFSLLTADPDLTDEVRNVFGYIENPYRPVRFNHLLVSPRNSRKQLYRLIDNEIANAKLGKKASITLKVNNLVDRGLINKLYGASTFGVDIKMIIRGMCSLVPGVEGVSDNIQIISIVDRFLEHPLFITKDNLRSFYFQQPFQTIVTDNYTTV